MCNLFRLIGGIVWFLNLRYNSDSEVYNINAEKQQKNLAIGLRDFEFIKPLGQGAFGGVYLVRKKTSQDLFAMKIIDCS
jgi:hypothetical protein